MNSELKSYSYYRNVFRNSTFPLAFIDMDMLNSNIDAMASRAGSKKVRIVTKSVRCVHITKYILRRRPDIYYGVMAYCPEEAIHLFKNGINDIIIAYPYINKQQLSKLAGAIKKGALIRIMVDHIKQAQNASDAAVSSDINFEVCLDLDMSTKHFNLYFGVYRSPLKTPGDTVALAEKISQLPGLTITGLMGYEAQIAGVGDRIPGKTIQNMLVKILKKQSFPRLSKKRTEVCKALRNKGFNISHVYGGGTGSFEFTRTEENLTEITAGSGFYNSGLFDFYSNFRHLPAAAFALEITRIPGEKIYTASGGGYIASGTTDPAKQPFPYLPQGITPVKNEGFGEIQTPFYYSGEENLQIGDPVFFRHSKAGELCERFKVLHLVRKGEITDTVPTYRGEVLCTL